MYGLMVDIENCQRMGFLIDPGYQFLDPPRSYYTVCMYALYTVGVHLIISVVSADLTSNSYH